MVRLVPQHCRGCQRRLAARPSPHDPEPTWHQVVELPRRLAEVTEYQGHARTCTRCGVVTHAAIPAEVRRHSIGPRLASFLAYLRGAHHVSQRGLEEIVEAALDVPLSVGMINRLEQQTSAALAAAHDEALAAVRAAPVKYVDETGWKRAGGWLWLAERRQMCWAHLKRDFQKCVDRGGPAAVVGRAGLRVVRALFDCWHRHRDRDGPIDRDQLLADITPLTRRLERALKAGRSCADAKAATFCENLLGHWPALWLFVLEAGVEPTNNHAARAASGGLRRCTTHVAEAFVRQSQ